MLNMIQTATILIFLSSITAQRWPKGGSCQPCHCSVKESKYTYGLLKHVNCSNLGLVTVPTNIPTDADFLDLSYNHLDITEIDSVCDFHSLQFLSLAYNFFTSLDDSPFSKCSLLVKLDLTGSSIFHLKNDSFNGLNNLQTIYGLEAESVEEGVFEKMHKLETLEFLFLGDSIPENIFKGLPVETLNLTLNMAVKIPLGLFEFGEKTLQFLCLKGPKVTFVYENLFRGLTVLRKVHMHMPKLESLPERLFSNFGVVVNNGGDPRNLQEVILSSMNTIPNTIFKDLESLTRLEIHEVHEIAIAGLFNDLVNLEVLDLTYSSIVQIPPEWFSKLYSLKTLNLSNCNLRSMEDRSLTGLMNLKTLDLSMNALRSIALTTFDPLRNSIQNLHLRGNILKVIDNQLFKQMFALQFLDLSDNKIANISENAFSDLKRLNSLQLQENKLSFLPLKLFQQQQDLQVLYLGTNSFRRIPLSVMKSAGFLLRLYLPKNRIFTIPRTLPTDLPYLEYMSLMDNSLQCRCRLLSVRLYKPNLYIDGICAAPFEFRGRHVMSFDVPENCEGPRPSPKVTSEIPQATPSSTVPSYQPQGQYYKYDYDNYYYGSDEYYLTDHYYVDLKSEEKISLVVTSSSVALVTRTNITLAKSESSSEEASSETGIGQIVITPSQETNRTSAVETSKFAGMSFTHLPQTVHTDGLYTERKSSHFSDPSTALFASSEGLYTTSVVLPTEPLTVTLIANDSKSVIITSSHVEKESSSLQHKEPFSSSSPGISEESVQISSVKRPLDTKSNSIITTTTHEESSRVKISTTIHISSVGSPLDVEANTNCPFPNYPLPIDGTILPGSSSLRKVDVLKAAASSYDSETQLEHTKYFEEGTESVAHSSVSDVGMILSTSTINVYVTDSETQFKHTKYSEEGTAHSSISDSGMLLPTSTINVYVTAVSEKPHGNKVETETSGMSVEVKGIIGFLGVAAFICILGTLWWLKTQVAKRRMYEVTPSSTVV